MAEEKEPYETATVRFQNQPDIWYYRPRQRISYRLEELAQPTKYIGQMYDADAPYRVKRTALCYRITDRLRNLAAPSPRRPYSNQPPFKVPKRALKAKTTPRIEVLAQPKTLNQNDFHTRNDPFSVSRQALRAKANKHIQELAQPKEYINYSSAKKFKPRKPFLFLNGSYI